MQGIGGPQVPTAYNNQMHARAEHFQGIYEKVLHNYVLSAMLGSKKSFNNKSLKQPLIRRTTRLMDTVAPNEGFDGYRTIQAQTLGGNTYQSRFSSTHELPSTALFSKSQGKSQRSSRVSINRGVH